MTVDPFDAKSSPELVQMFTALALAKGHAMLTGESAKTARLTHAIRRLREVMKARSDDDRRLLAVLYDHPDPSVRLEAASATLTTHPEESRRVLKAICDNNEFPFAGDAGMRLHNLETGFYKPT